MTAIEEQELHRRFRIDPPVPGGPRPSDDPEVAAVMELSRRFNIGLSYEQARRIVAERKGSDSGNAGD